ncbi:unnamed protein product [Mycena citricolor]|uniref:Cell cycle control protein n=1 Tax=Mycena citricolor TaxID=2018698 RepID=A0AAD2HR02_9AGAR|nr:unnamed protein product [Mycena citricolor]
MGLFNRKTNRGDESDETTEVKKEKGGWRRPANTAFKQQRLKAWQLILTPKTVLPTLFIIAIVFAPIGGLLIWGSSMVSEIVLDYTQCENLTPSSANGSLSFSTMPSSQYSYKLRAADAGKNIVPPTYAFLDNTNNASVTDPLDKKQCIIQFNIPADIDPSSLNSDQLKGKFESNSTLSGGDCKPLDLLNGKAIYPCGLIANSIFNDTFTSPVLQNPGSNVSSTTYEFSAKGIAWPGEAQKYTSNPVGPGGYNSYDDIVPPPNWQLRYPTYNASNMPDLKNDERFQNWMRTAGLPTFTKLYGRNDNDKMTVGTYQIIVGLIYRHLDCVMDRGKNAFLGWAYVGAAAVFILLAIAGTARHLIKPRRLGDMSLLSWNR